ncbi:restriction endonuclease subunit S, partial [Ralstonia pseudosolanacearum]|uniref:restriction endonuclease subunit S n=1 Tax=Ralstonia pseudosolanacearum TaxID=1310165 RepID=UPI0018D07739
PAKVENLRSQPGCLQRYLSGPLHVNVSSPRGAAGLCNNAAVKAQFRFFSVGTKVSGISKSNIGKITISVPSIEEQTAIAIILSDMDAEIATLEAKLTKARSVKRGMMQQLLTGKIRLI